MEYAGPSAADLEIVHRRDLQASAVRTVACWARVCVRRPVCVVRREHPHREALIAFLVPLPPLCRVIRDVHHIPDLEPQIPLIRRRKLGRRCDRPKHC